MGSLTETRMGSLTETGSRGSKLDADPPPHGVKLARRNTDGNVAAVDAADNEAGYYNSNTLHVHDEHRRRGLAIALALWAHERRSTLPTKRDLSADGRKALTAAWEVASKKGRTSPWWP